MGWRDKRLSEAVRPERTVIVVEATGRAVARPLATPAGVYHLPVRPSARSERFGQV
ncbi:MAG: hypothetical protein AAGK98_12175 [Pseudomonadota bacterium]